MREIYLICNSLTNQWYIGCSYNASKRLKGHISSSRSGNKSLLCANIRRYGEEFFDVEVLETCEEWEACSKEKGWIQKFLSLNESKSLNSDKGGSGTFSEKSRGKISNSMNDNKNRVGTCHSNVSKERMRESKIGKSLSEDHKLAISKATVGVPKSEKQKAAMSKAQSGKVLTEEHKKKISASNKGNVRKSKVCEICGTCISVQTYNRSHGELCSKSISE